MLSWIKGLFNLSTLLPQIVTGTFSWLNKKQDTALAENTNAVAATTAAMQSEAALVGNYLNSAMSHPFFWAAWCFGVFPVLGYHAAIFFVSTFPQYGWTVLRVPDVELEYGRQVVGSVFALTGATSLISGVASAWLKRT